MRRNAKNMSVEEIMNTQVRVDEVVQPYVMWFDTDEKIAECIMSDNRPEWTKSLRPINTPTWLDDYLTLSADECVPTFTIHRFDVYQYGVLVARVL